MEWTCHQSPFCLSTGVEYEVRIICYEFHPERIDRSCDLVLNFAEEIALQYSAPSLE